MTEYLKKNGNTNITKSFKIHEAFDSATAQREGIDNYPDESNVFGVLGRIFLMAEIMQIVRNLANRPCDVGSWWRCDELQNLLATGAKNIGASTTSDHPRGGAVDFEVRGYDRKQMNQFHLTLEYYLKENGIEFDQLIFETRGRLTWIHLGVRFNRPNRNKVFDILK